MSDALRRNSGTQRLLPNEFSRQLQAICGGHALWAPRRVENGGGSLGDAGYISQGSFYKEFNVYEDPPSSTNPLPRPTVGVYMNEQFNMPIMQSSQESRIELRLKGSSDVVPLPLAVAPLSVEPSVVLQREKLAFLVPPMPARRDSLNRERRDEFCDWLSVNRHKIREDTILVTQAVRSSGWVGGVVTGKRTEVTGDVTADVAGVARMSVGASTALETVQMARIQGPDDWTPDAGANYTLIINFTMARSRMERLMHRLKVQISDLGRTDSPTPAKAAGPSAAPNQESKAGRDDQTGSQLENLPVDALSLFDEPLSTAPENATRLSDWDDDAPAHNANTSDDEDDLTLLKVILDEVLADNDDVDVAIADSSIITGFYERNHGALRQHAARSPSRESSATHLMDPVVVKRRIVSQSTTGPRIETMAFVESIQLRAETLRIEPGIELMEAVRRHLRADPSRIRGIYINPHLGIGPPDNATAAFVERKVADSPTADAYSASAWYGASKPMLEKLLHRSRYSDTRCDEVLAFFGSQMVPFLGPMPELATSRWRSFVNTDNTPLSLSLAWDAARPAPRTRLAIDIIPATTDAIANTTCKRSIDFAGALRQYMDGRNAVAITNFDLESFYAMAEQLFIPVLQNSEADEIVADLVSGPSLSFFGLDIEESETKVETYFVPELSARSQDEDVLFTMTRTFMALVPEDAVMQATLGAFEAWREIVSFFATLAEEDIPLLFMLSVDCVPRLDARYRVYFRCVSCSPEELQRLMSLDGRVELSSRHMQGVIDLWSMLHPSVDLLQSQVLLCESGLSIAFEFKQSSPLPTATVYFPVQQWVSNDLKVAHVIARWLETYGHPEAAATYVDIASEICAPRRLVEGSGFHTYVGVAPTEDGGCEATTYYNPGLFRQESSFASGSTG